MCLVSYSLNTKNECVYMHVFVLPENRTLANFDITVIVRNIINSPETLSVPTPHQEFQLYWLLVV